MIEMDEDRFVDVLASYMKMVQHYTDSHAAFCMLGMCMANVFALSKEDAAKFEAAIDNYFTGLDIVKLDSDKLEELLSKLEAELDADKIN